MSSGSGARLPRWLIAAALTGVVLWASDPGAVWRAAAGAHPGFLAAAAGLVLVDRALMAYRWIILLRVLDPHTRPALGAVLRIFFVSTFVGTFLPASVGGDAVRAFQLARLNVPAADAVASVFMDRMLGVVSLLVMSIVGLAIARDLAGEAVVQIALAIAAMASAAGLAAVFSRAAGERLARLAGALPFGAAREAGVKLLDAVQRYATHHAGILLVLISSLAVQALRIVQAWLLGRALGIEIGMAAYFAFIPLILLVMLLPVTVNGLGTSQAAFVWFFSRVGVSAAASFALSVMFVALGILGNLPGGLLYATDWGRVGTDAEVGRRHSAVGSNRQ